jgi:hypothetical protein
MPWARSRLAGVDTSRSVHSLKKFFPKTVIREILAPIHTHRALWAIALGPLSTLTTGCGFSLPKPAKRPGAVLDRQPLNRGVSYALLGIHDAFSWLEGGTRCSRVHFSIDRLIFIPSRLTAFTIKGPPGLGTAPLDGSARAFSH